MPEKCGLMEFDFIWVFENWEFSLGEAESVLDEIILSWNAILS